MAMEVLIPLSRLRQRKMAFKHKHRLGNQGFSLAEMLVVTLLTSIMFTAGFILFTTGQIAWAMTNTKIQLQESLRRSIERISVEVSASGRDNTNTLRLSVLDNTGVNNTDVLRFAIPLCTCGTGVTDQSAEVKAWGAPPTWYSSGCATTWATNAQGKVDICHLPPGNPNNTQDLEVSPSAVNAHLAHGDRIGSCGSCDPTAYTNRKIEYLLDNNNQLLRRVLDTNNNVLYSVVITPDITDFQATVNGQVVTLTVQFSKKALPNKIIVVNSSFQILLRNYD